MSITLRYTTSREQAVSILNDAFMKVFDNISGYDIKRPFKPWFRKIVVNTAINHYQKNSKLPTSVSLELIGDEIDPSETIISGISYREIIKLIQELSPTYRTVFNLYVIEGFKHHEIAEILGISVGTSKSNLSKAKRNLQDKLEKILTVSHQYAR